MSLYRIALTVENAMTRSSHGEWFSATDLPFLHRTLGVLNARHGPGTYRIEERVVTRAAQMMSEAITTIMIGGSTGNEAKWRGLSGNA